MSQKLIKNSFALYFLIIILTLWFSGYFGYPLPLGDKEGFYPVIFNFSVSGEYSHPFMCYTCEERMGNPENKYFSNHGFIFPKTLSSLFFFDSYKKIETSSINLLLINFSLLLIVFHYFNIFDYVKFTILFSFFIFQIGRPELLVSTILILDFYVSKKNYFKKDIYLIAFFTATIFCISPLSAVIYFVYNQIKNRFISIESKYYLSIVYYLLTILLIIILFYIFVNEFSFYTWIFSILKAGGHHSNEFFDINKILNPGFLYGNFSEYWTYIIKGPKSIPLLFLAIICVIILLLENFSKLNFFDKIFLFAFFILLYWFALRRPIFNYTIIGFIPFLFLVIDEKKTLFLKYKKILLNFFFLACFSSLTIFSLVTPILYLLKGIKPDTLEESLHKIQKPETISIPKQFWMFSNKDDNITFQLKSNPYQENFNDTYVYVSSINLKGTKDKLNKIKNYCIDEIKVKNEFFRLYDYSYIRYKKCKIN